MGVVIDCKNCKIMPVCRHYGDMDHLRGKLEELLGDVSHDHIPVVEEIEADISVPCTYYQDNHHIREPQYGRGGCK